MAAESSMKTREKAVFVAQQLHFANTLAGNDPKHRSRAMKKLRKYFIARANGNFNFTHDDFMRIWKGLFYCMWMSDKPLVQEELAEEISQLVHCFQHVDTALTFVQSFFDTLLIEWFGIDYHRIDKFQMFVRRFLRQSLVYCKNKDWKTIPVSGLCDVFESTIMSPSKCVNECGDISLIMHFVDIFVEELAKVGTGKLSKEIILMFLKPFMTNLAGQDDSRLQNVIRDRIFLCLIRQSPEGLEYEEKFEAWKRAGFPGTSWKDMVFVGKEDNRSGVKISNLDPRAGKVNVYLPHLQFDAASVAKALQESSEKASSKKSQKALRGIAHKFRVLAKGIYPLAQNLSKTLLNAQKYRFSKQKIDDAVEDLLEFEEKLKKKDKKCGKRKKNSSKLKKAKKMKLEISCADKEDDTVESNSDLENEKSSDDENQEEANDHFDLTLTLNDQNEESDPELLENGGAGIHENVDYSASVAKEHVNSDEDGTHGSDDDDSCLAKVTKRDIKKHNVSPWDVSEISSPQEKIAGIFQEQEESRDSEKENVVEKDLNEEIPRDTEKENVVEKDLNEEIPRDTEKTCFEETSLQNNCQDSQEEEEKESKVSCEIELDGQAKEVVTPLRRSTRRRSTMVTTPNTVNQKEEEIISEGKLPSENGQTPFRKRKSLTPGSIIRTKRRISTVPDREILNINENGEVADSVNDFTTNVPDSSGASSVNETCNGVLTNNDMLNKQRRSPSQKGFRTPGKKRVSLISTPGSAKKVNIVLQLNKSQALSEYNAALKLSPSIPFDANKMPCKGVLKRTSLRSPINPFYVPPGKPQ